MGALAPVSAWIPEDDILLKNAVEAGASLESLAKGAVQFSQKFTIRELQERWHSLLYDPVVSADAAFHMFEFERSASNLPSKFNRAGNSRENKCIPGKRKAESVRSSYYALRKRICNEPFSSMDFSFLEEANDSNYNEKKDNPLSGHCVLGDPVSDHFRLQETDFEIMQQGFQQIEGGGADHAFCAQFPQFQNTVQRCCPMEQDDVHEKHEETLVEDFVHLNSLPVDCDPEQGCSTFDGNHIFSSPITECGSSFHNLEFSSPIPEMPIWRTDECISVPCIPIVDDTINACSSGYDGVHRESNLKLQIPGPELKNGTTSTEQYLAELSNSLLDFSNEELLLMDVDAKESLDKSFYDGLSSLLLSSPIDNQDHIPNGTKPESSETTDFPTNQSSTCLGRLDQDRGSNYNSNMLPEVQFPTCESASNTHFPEMSDGIICCALNTEDPEIPCNDDIVFTKDSHPKSVSPVARGNLQDAARPNLSSINEFSCNQKTNGGPVLMLSDSEILGQSNTSSQMTISRAMPEIGLLHPVHDHEVKFEVPSSNLADSSAGNVNGSSTQINSVNAIMETIVPGKLKEETALVNLLSQNSADCLKRYPQTNASGIKEELHAPARPQNHQASTASEQVINHPTSDLEELPIESDYEVPYFSDIEAMILDMDLDPEDQDLYTSEEVLQYQHEETKRSIMRLEQSAHACVQRAIASHGAFAILYGRRSKHYIKKPEVLLGRDAEDVIVDIDLGREGPANKISRRQAIIFLDESGSFQLKNLGKCSISVNDKEIAPGQILGLTSSCLIEIRGMPFVFETNPTNVKWYLDKISQRDQTQEQQV